MIGKTVRARVTETFASGVVLEQGGIEILVLVPEISWSTCPVDIEGQFTVGDEIDVKILRSNPDTGGYVGSIRRTKMEHSPFHKYVSQVKCRMDAVVAQVLPPFEGATIVRVQLPDGIKAQIKVPSADCGLSVGDDVSVVVIGVDAENGELKLKLEVSE